MSHSAFTHGHSLWELVRFDPLLVTWNAKTPLRTLYLKQIRHPARETRSLRDLHAERLNSNIMDVIALRDAPRWPARGPWSAGPACGAASA